MQDPAASMLKRIPIRAGENEKNVNDPNAPNDLNDGRDGLCVRPYIL